MVNRYHLFILVLSLALTFILINLLNGSIFVPEVQLTPTPIPNITNTIISFSVPATDPAAPLAKFIANTTEDQAPLAIQFIDQSEDKGHKITSWEWDFGDGSANSTLQNPVHTFNVLGYYYVTLTVGNDYGYSSYIMRVSINCPDSLRLITIGNRVTFQNGSSIYLRGSSFDDIFGTVNYCGVDNYSTVDSAVKQMKAWNYTVMRLNIMPEFWEHSGIGTGVWASGQRDYPHLLDMVVDVCRRNGMYVIIEWHAIGNPVTGRKNYDINVNAYEWENPCDPNYDNATYFWQNVSARYGNEPMVLFSLFNEPGDWITWDQWQPYAQNLVNIVRANSSNIILVSGISYAYNISGALSKPIKSSNIVYETHIYPESTVWGSWDKLVGCVAAKYPVFLGEWNVAASRENNHTFLIPLMYYVNDKKFVGWTSFGWSYWTGLGGQVATYERYNYSLCGFGEFVKRAANDQLPPLASFKYLGKNQITFTDTSRNATAWQWDFGDGSTKATTRIATHTYQPGKYTVMLKASNQWGSDITSIVITV